MLEHLRDCEVVISLRCLGRKSLVEWSCIKKISCLLSVTFTFMGVAGSLSMLHIFSTQMPFQISSTEPQSKCFNFLSPECLLCYLWISITIPIGAYSGSPKEVQSCWTTPFPSTQLIILWIDSSEFHVRHHWTGSELNRNFLLSSPKIWMEGRVGGWGFIRTACWWAYMGLQGEHQSIDQMD